MPISPFYKRMYTENDPRGRLGSRELILPQPGDFNYIEPRQLDRSGILPQPGDFDMGADPRALDRSRILPQPGDFDMPDALPMRQLDRSGILPQPGDFDMEGQVEIPDMQPQPRPLDRSRILPQPGDIDETGKVPIPDLNVPEVQSQTAPGVQKTALEQIKEILQGTSTTQQPQQQMQAYPDQQMRDREMLTALAQFSAGMGNIAGTPTQTTTPDWMKRQTDLDMTMADRAQKQQIAQEDFAIRRLIRENEMKKAGLDATKAAMEQQKQKDANDPNSVESRNARALLETYFQKYAPAGTKLPEDMPAAAIYKFLPGLSNIARGEIAGSYGLIQTGMKGEQAEKADIRRAQTLERIEDIKARYKQLENDNSQKAELEKLNLKNEHEALMKELELDTRERIVEKQGQTAVKVANIGAKSREKVEDKRQQGLKDRAAATRAKMDQYRAYKEVKQAAKAYSEDKIVRNYLEIVKNKKRIENNMRNPTAVGDVATVFDYIKTLDPGSVVRPGEVSLLQEAQSIKDRILNIYERTAKGTQLTPVIRKQIYDDVVSLERLSRDNVKYLNDTIRAVAKEGNWSPESFLIKFGGQPGGGISVGGETSGATVPAQPKIKVYKPGGAK